jgi:hypothetical protein
VEDRNISSLNLCPCLFVFVCVKVWKVREIISESEKEEEKDKTLPQTKKMNCLIIR